MKPKIEKIDGLELRLEGIKVDFSSIQISEAEGSLPAVAIVFPANSGALRVLPGTIIHFYANVYNALKNAKEPTLLFEGEVSGVQYQKTPMGENIVLNGVSLLSRMFGAQLRPSDVILTQQRKDKQGIGQVKVLVINDQANPSKKNPVKNDLIQNNITVGPASNAFLKSLIATKQDSLLVDGSTSTIGQITAMLGIADEFSRSLQDESVKKGDIFKLVVNFNTYFERNDLYYGITSNSFKISPSVFAFPNEGMMRGFQVKAAWESVKGIIQRVGMDPVGNMQTFNLIQCLASLCQHIYYNLNVPAAFPAVKMFYLKKGQINDYGPLRLMYMPQIDSGPPALPNIFFPEEVNSFIFSRDMVSEITRLLGEVQYPYTEKFPSWMRQVYVVPSLDAELENNRITSNFTLEESYRGVTSKIIGMDGSVLKALNKDRKLIDNIEGKDKTGVITDKEVGGEVGLSLRSHMFNQYLNMKYSTRIVSITTAWNPFRLIGLPGMMFNLNRPTIVGVVASVNTTFLADGNATSNVVMRGCKIIFDEDAGSVFNPASPTDTAGLEQYAVNDLTNDGVVSLTELTYNREYYGFENIGEDIYTYLCEGTSGINRRFEKKLGESIWKRFKTNLSQEKFPDARNIDYSILKYIKERTTSGVQLSAKATDAIEALKKSLGDTKYITNEVRYTSLLYQAITAFKEEYKKVVNSKINDHSQHAPIHQYIDYLTWRHIISKTDYLNFISATDDSVNHYKDTKDLAAILQINDHNKTFKRGNLEAEIKANSQNLQESDYSTTKGTNVLSLEQKKTKIRKLEEEKKNLKKTLDDLESIGETSWAVQEYKKRYPKGTDYLLRRNRLLQDYGKLVKETKAKIASIETQIKNLQKEQKVIIAKVSKGATATSGANDIKDPAIALFRPYNITRRVHVLNGFKNELKGVLSSINEAKDNIRIQK